jgi:hypothetical protein
MKLKATLLTAALVLAGTFAQAQIVTNGNFEAGQTGWTTWTSAGTNTLTYNYTGDAPTGGSGNVLRLQIGSDYSEAGAYQAITLTGGNTYRFDGLAKIVSASPTSTWMEVWIGTAVPVDGVVYNSGVGAVNVARINTWVCPGYDGTWVAGCETPNGGEFTVPGSGSITYHLMIRSGVCCGGGPAEVVVDNVVVTDLGAGPSFDAPPTTFFEDFNDGDGINNYGGNAIAFAGGDPGGNFTVQDASMTIAAVDAQGTTGLAGDFAQHIFANTPLTGQSFIYYGVVQRLSPSGTTMQDLSGFAELSFDIKLGSGSATTGWAVRLEDNLTDNNNAGNYNFINLEPFLTTSYQTVTIPLTNFVSNADGGFIAPNLAMVPRITFVSRDVSFLTPVPDIYIDNLRIGSSSTVDQWEIFH